MPGWVQFVNLRLPCAYLLKKAARPNFDWNAGIRVSAHDLIHLAELLFLRPG